MLDHSVVQYFAGKGYQITSTDDYLTIRKVEEYGGCLIIFIVAISVFAVGYSYIGVIAIFLSIIALVVYFIDKGKDYKKVVFDFPRNRLHLASGSIYMSDKTFYLNDVEEIKLKIRKFDSFTSAFKAGNKDYVLNIHLKIKSADFIILTLLSDSENIDEELMKFIAYLEDGIR